MASARSSKPRKPVIAITLGDPGGIGPEVIVKALALLHEQTQGHSPNRYIVYGMNELLTYAADVAGIPPFWWRVAHGSEHSRDFTTGPDFVVIDHDEYSGTTGVLAGASSGPSKRGGEASLAFINAALQAALEPPGSPGHVDAIVTAPISKTSWSLAGLKRFPGHTELFAERTRAKEFAMMFVAPQLRTILATTHIPLMDVRNVLTIGQVLRPIDLGYRACREMLGIANPRIAVCGLNPHASEGGLFGDEERRVIEPAIRQAIENGIDARGPFPADTVFHAAVDGTYDLVVAMYHDQGLIPVKLLAWEDAVNVTVGLPIIRTSPDHGTAFDIVGRNLAKPGSMLASIRLAVQMVQAKRTRELGSV